MSELGLIQEILHMSRLAYIRTLLNNPDEYMQIFNASHMAPYDVPHVTHDMMLRFMGVDFKAIVEGSAKIPSSVGSTSKPIFVGQEEAKQTPAVAPAKTPEQDKAMWEGTFLF